MTELCDLCEKYGTDKGPRRMNGWDYSPTYDTVLKSRRASTKKVLEVGICGYRNIPNNVVGASLFVWRDYFPNAVIYGLDNDNRFIFNDQDRIYTSLCNAYDSDQLRKSIASLGLVYEDLDFIVDDAVHDPPQQVALLKDLWPYLAPGGIYAMEDVCPCKLINGDVTGMFPFFPKDRERVQIVNTYKDEKLLLIYKPDR